jgi:hypothetical protein
MLKAAATTAADDLPSLFGTMKRTSKSKYRMFRNHRTGIYFIQDNQTGRQESLRTRDKTEAARLLNARNEAHRQRSRSR